MQEKFGDIHRFMIFMPIFSKILKKVIYEMFSKSYQVYFKTIYYSEIAMIYCC